MALPWATGMNALAPVKRRSDELQLHIAVADYLKLALPAEVIWFHPANGEKRDLRSAAKLKAMGVKAGVADLIFALPGGRFGAIELKAGVGRPSEAQNAFALACADIGAAYGLCRSLNSVACVLASWGVALKARPQ